MAGRLDNFLDREEDEPAAAPAAEAVNEAPEGRDIEIEDAPPQEAAPTERVPHVAEEVLEPESEDQGDPSAVVPRSAFVAARKDWKGKADRLEGELSALRAQMEEFRQKQAAQPPAPVYQPPPQQRAEPKPFPAAPNPIEDPAGYAQWFEAKQANDRANISEVVLRAEIANDAEVNAKIAVFQQAAEANPRLAMALRVHPDPYRYAFEQGAKIEQQRAEAAKRDAMLKELGDDPQAWIAKQKEELAAQIRQELEAELSLRAPAAAAQVNLPTSLATARSSAPRAAVGQEIPETFGDILKSRRRAQA